METLEHDTKSSETISLEDRFSPITIEDSLNNSVVYMPDEIDDKLKELARTQINANGIVLKREHIRDVIKEALPYNKYDNKIIEKKVKEGYNDIEFGKGFAEQKNAYNINELFNNYDVVARNLKHLARDMASGNFVIKDNLFSKVLKESEEYLGFDNIKAMVANFYSKARKNIECKDDNIKNINKEKYKEAILKLKGKEFKNSINIKKEEKATLKPKNLLKNEIKKSVNKNKNYTRELSSILGADKELENSIIISRKNIFEL